MIDYDVNIKKNDFEEFKKKEIEDQKEKELERIRELERERFRERERLENEMKQLKENEIEKKEIEKQESFENKIKSQTQKVVLPDDSPSKDINEEINEERKVLDEIKDEKEEIQDNTKDKINVEKREIEQTIKEKEELEQKLNEEKKKMLEKAIKNRQEMEKRIEIKLKGFEEFLENKKVTNVSKNSFALYNVNWFNVCCGLEKLDDTFEEEINKQIIDMGIILDENEISENLLKLFEDKRELVNFKKMIKNRIITCSEIEPPSFFEKIFSDSFGTFKQCDKRSPQSILYLYDDYRTFLEKDISLTKLEKVLILIYCETRQHNLSKYISLEIIRKENEKKRSKNIIKILDEIMKGDSTIIRNNDKMLKQKTKLKYEQYKRDKLEEVNEKNRIQTLVNENNIIIQKKKVENLVEERDEKINETRKKKNKELENQGILSKLGKLFESNKDTPIFDLTLTPKEREAYEKAMKHMKGGSEEDMINYKLTDETKSNMCNKIKGEKNIYKEQLSMINHCFN